MFWLVSWVTGFSLTSFDRNMVRLLKIYLKLYLVLATVRRLVGLLRFGDAVWFFSPRVAGDLDRVRGEPGTDSVGLGETGLENGVRGDPGIERLFLHGKARPPQQSSSSSRSSEHTERHCELISSAGALQLIDDLLII